MGRPPCCDKEVVKKGPWTPEEDIILVSYVQDHGPGNWRAVPASTGLMRCSKSCRLRWTNYLRPGIRRGNFSDQEEKLIVHLQALLGNRWAAIASYLPERTDNDIKNYWNTHLKKKLRRTTYPPTALQPEQQRSPPPNKGQWERRLQTDINLARRALRDALSVDVGASPPGGSATSPASEEPNPGSAPGKGVGNPATPGAAESASGSSELTECSGSSASNCAAPLLGSPLFGHEGKAAAGEEVPLSAIESWLLLDDGSEQPAQEDLLLDVVLRNYAF